ncbi:FAD-dependent monooxygenase [Nocardioides luteus]|uniref:FAD-dependent monooxygenase n=1 Tax=Nocardioides luteus TaxID=1844 RepID=UPI0018CA37BE|nr:FAD-dependent monooxygenase [Nocardioides luteus]MBG6098018.1 anthraniloyl-CoA monooxygenase [Nocardioides luteus]
MELRSVAVLGGGPGGLYVARLVKLRHPECAVDLYEQSPPHQTFGFGVGLATRTQRNLEAADPASLAAIVERSFQHEMAMEVRGQRSLLPVDNLIAIGRSTLLDVLRQYAEEAGVRLHYGERVSAAELDVELVIAADGVSSATREEAADAFGATVDTHESLYLWCGTDFALPSALFVPVETEHGTFVAHGYPYAPDRSTFLVETDEETWRRAGFDLTTARTRFDQTDEESLAYLSAAFKDELEGHSLIGNRTRWLQFRTVRCARWHQRNVVLLGDAAHTAHYSIGSGTKLAMEDGIALDAALAAAPDLPTALDRYETERRPAVEHLQDTARRSMRWWDTFPDRLDLPVDQLLIAYMTRAGKVSVDRFAVLADDVVRRGLSQYAGCAVSDVPDDARTPWILSRPLARDGKAWPSRLVSVEELGVHDEVVVDVRDPWGPEGDALVKQLATGIGQPAGRVLLRAEDDLGSTLTMFDLGERLRRETGSVVAARVDERWTENAVAALASGRIDLVVHTTF